MQKTMWKVCSGVAQNPTAQLYLHNSQPRITCSTTSDRHRRWGIVRARLRTIDRFAKIKVSSILRRPSGVSTTERGHAGWSFAALENGCESPGAGVYARCAALRSGNAGAGLGGSRCALAWQAVSADGAAEVSCNEH